MGPAALSKGVSAQPIADRHLEPDLDLYRTFADAQQNRLALHPGENRSSRYFHVFTRIRVIEPLADRHPVTPPAST